jgi:DNA-binding ferritin-like protein
MASSVTDRVKNLGESMADSAKNMFENEKIADLKKNVKDSHSKQHQTTDYGIKVADLDHWLKVVDEENDKVGPSLLEDQIARERVCTLLFTASNPKTYLATDSSIRPRTYS